MSGTASSSEIPGTGQRRDGDWDGFCGVIYCIHVEWGRWVEDDRPIYMLFCGFLHAIVATTSSTIVLLLLKSLGPTFQSRS